ncbi:MAG: N-acetylmuramoyl-L-alanine amidase [Acidobacteria bacterium]|nr:N-acetylmuramoyl-L-alanine amidase [Acidobacteriota bacterium]
MKTIIVCAGHSDQQSGAVSPDGKYKEEDLAQRLRNRVATLLRADGQFRVLTDGGDRENKPLRDAVQLVKANPGALAIEIHFNAASQPSVKGVEVLSKPQHKLLAQQLAFSIAEITGSPLRGVLGWRADNAGQHHRLAFCEVGGAIVEVEFLSNPDALTQYLTLESEVAISLANALRDAAKGV